MVNPFETIENRLANLETLLLELKNSTLPELIKGSIHKEPKIVTLEKLIELRPVLGSKSSIYKKTHSGTIPHSKSGRKLLFELKKVDEWLMDTRIERNFDKEVEEILRSGKGK